MTRSIRGVGTVVATALLAAPLTAQHFPPERELAAMIQQRVDEGRAVGLVLGVMEADGSTTVVAAGSAGPDARPIGERTLFEIGSITKTFTAVLLADMARREELDLTDPVASLLPDGVRVPSRNGRRIALEDLSTHFSGLPRMPSNFDPADPTNPYVDYTDDLLYEFLAEHELRRDVGAEFEYSNVGVGLLGHALSLRVGDTYERVVRARILDPLGMDMTGVVLRGDMLSWMAQGHDELGNVVSLWDLDVLVGAGGLRANVRDMLRYLAANTGPPGSALEEAMRSTHVKRREISAAVSIGLGWHVFDVGDARIVAHSGGTGGFRTFIGFDPELHVGTVILSNSRHGADDIALHLLNPGLPLVERSVFHAGAIVVGALALLLGLAGFLTPTRLMGIAGRASSKRALFYAGTVARGAAGVVLILAAPTSRYPIGLIALGGLFVLAALAMPFVGLRRVQRLVDWWTERPSILTRLVSLGPVAVGLVILSWTL